MNHKIKDNHPVVTPFPLSSPLHGVSHVNCEITIFTWYLQRRNILMQFGDLFSLRATGACAGAFLMPSLLLGSLLVRSLLAVPCALFHRQSPDPGAAAVCPPSAAVCSQRSKTDEKVRVSWSEQRRPPASIHVVFFPPFLFIQISYRKCGLLPHLSPFRGLFWPHKVCCPLSLSPAPWACMPRRGPLPNAHQGHHPCRTPSLQYPGLSLLSAHVSWQLPQSLCWSCSSCMTRWAWAVSGVSQEGPDERDCPPIDSKLFFSISTCIVFCLI